MSGPATALPPEIAELMTVTAAWEKHTGVDGHGQPVYASPVSINCWLEQSGFVAGGLEAVRRPTNTAVDIEYDLYFNGSDTNAQQFTLLDRFTITPVSDGPIAIRLGLPGSCRIAGLETDEGNVVTVVGRTGIAVVVERC